jgi:hypothetical protein
VPSDHLDVAAANRARGLRVFELLREEDLAPHEPPILVV